ncbi:MAG: hypothetical protein H0T76_15480 [Nannocystis sp.]|nr:hypothetical protein [Nannocystis sp.]MBA3547884.1 hypothetical protein [Nannocystis sp.]
MSVARPALPFLLGPVSLGPLLLALACSAHPPAPAAEMQASQTLSAGTSAPPQPVLAASLAASAAPDKATPAATPAATPPSPAPTPTVGAGGLAPLSREHRATMLAGAEDTLAPTPIHYVKSNEVRHDVWFPYVAGLGGAYLGVGSDQNYTVAGVARSELMFLSDIDRSVVDLHRVYEVLIEASDTPEALLERFDAGQTEASLALLTTAFAELPAPEQRRLLGLYRAARETVYIHLLRVIKRRQGEVGTTWLSDRGMYDHIRGLFKADRVRAMGGDLTGANSLQTAASAARNLGVPFRVIYFSNAEEYFNYGAQFVSNIEAFPVDDRTVVLRTLYRKDWAHADQLWAYQVQPIADFRARLADRKNRSRNPMLRYAEIEGALNKETGTKGLSLIRLPVALGG